MKNFVIGKTIGQGSFGKVKIGVHSETNQKVAIKIIDKNKLINQELRSKVDEQIGILKEVKHRNIIQLYQVIQEQSFIYLIMQYAKKGDLLDYVKQQTIFTESQAAIIMIDIVNALIYLHQKNIAHRDIKLANILLTENELTKLTDFGLSKKYQTEGKLQTGCGSPCFAAPELMKDEPYNPQKVDVWAIGVVYFSLLSGQLPFYHHNITQLYEKIKIGEYLEPVTFNTKTKSLFKEFFNTDPQKRISLKQILQHNSLVVPKILREKQRKKINTSQCIQKIELIKSLLVRRKNLTKPEVQKVILERNFDDLNTTIQLMKKMSVSELHNLSEINHLRTPNLMISVSSSFKYSERTPMKTESNDLKKFQRKSIKKNMKIIKSTKILSSKQNDQTFKYISQKALMKYNEQSEKGKLQQILNKRRPQLKTNRTNIYKQRMSNMGQSLNLSKLNSFCKLYWNKQKPLQGSQYRRHIIQMKYEELIEKIQKVKGIKTRTQNMKKRMFLERNNIEYQISVFSMQKEQNEHIIRTQPFCPEIVVGLIQKLKSF